SGGLTLRAGSVDVAWVFTVHALIGGALAAAIVLKLLRSVPPAVAGLRWRRLLIATVVTVVAAAGLVGGYAWVIAGGVPSAWGFTILTLHAWAGLVLLPVVLVHLVPRRWRLLAPGPAALDRAARGINR